MIDSNEIIHQLTLENFQLKEKLAAYENKLLITNWKQNEKVLHENGEQYRLLAENPEEIDRAQAENCYYRVFQDSPIINALTNLNSGKFVDVNNTFLSFLGYQYEEVIGRTVSETGIIYNPADYTTIAKTISKNKSCKDFEVKLKSKHGVIFTCLFSAILTEINNELYLYSYCIDISKHKLAEMKLRQSNERFYTFFKSNPAIMAINKDEIYLDVNDTWLNAFGFTRDEVIGRTSSELNIWVDPGKLRSRLLELDQHNRILNYEVHFRRKNGETGLGLASSEVIYIDGETCYLHAMLDVTRERHMEKEIGQLDRLNLIGQMAASIGHEIRNPMTSVRGFLQLLKNQENYKKDQSYFSLMIEELDRANQIISEYLGMAKDKSVYLQQQYLDDVITSIYPILEADANYQGMLIKLDLCSSPLVLIDENEIRQLILNIARNGFEAMRPGGTLTIGTRMGDDDVILLIKDEGHGLSPLLINKLGTPFLTTKENGTGLGLAVCYSIASRLNAKITYETSPRGTTFYTHFPIIGRGI